MNLTNKNSKELFEKILDFSSDKITNKQDIERLLEIAINKTMDKEFESILFSAKAITGLMRIIRNRDNKFEDEYFNKLKTELTNNVNSVISGLKEITNAGGSFLNEIFDEKYYQIKSDSLQNLYSLCSDLEYVKMYFNDLKSENKNQSPD